MAVIEAEANLEQEVAEFVSSMRTIFNTSRGNHYKTSGLIIDTNLGLLFLQLWDHPEHVKMVQEIFVRIHQNDEFFVTEIANGGSAERMTKAVLRRLAESVDFLLAEC